jgi:HSPB1-associated protein 1
VQWETETISLILSFATFEAFLDPSSKGGEPVADAKDIIDDNSRTGDDDEADSLSGLSLATHWGYLSYGHMRDVFCGREEAFSSLDWSVLGGGMDGDGAESTLWVGSDGARTHCHYDTYGFNVVAQLHGRKEWVLFNPADTASLYPTRVPYEESSVFSEVNVDAPDLARHPLFALTSPIRVVLEPGQVLFVPRHWWHHVRCLEPAVSINKWCVHPLDGDARISEALVCCRLSVPTTHHCRCVWLSVPCLTLPSL